MNSSRRLAVTLFSLAIVAFLVTSLGLHGQAQAQVKGAVGKPAVSIVATDNRAIESFLVSGGGPLVGINTKGTFTVTRTAGLLGFGTALTVTYAVSGTATPGSDYSALPGTVTIPVGAASATIDVFPRETGFNPERDETVVVTLTGSPSSSYQIALPATATVTIIDNDQAVKVTAVDAQAAEAGPETGQFKFVRLGSESGQLTLNYSVSGTATPGVDYVALPGSVTLPDGVTEVIVTVTPIPDNQVEGDETVIVTLGSALGAPAAEPRSVTVTIADTVVTVGASQASMLEKDGNTANFVITRTGGKSQPLTVPFTISGSATNGVDYNTISSPAIIPVGAASVNVPLVTKSDPQEKGAETVVLTLSPATQYALGSPNSSTIVIEDNVPPRVAQVLLSPGTVVGGNSSTGTVRLTGPAEAEGLVVTLSSSSPSASLQSSTINISGGQTSADFSISTVPVAQDSPVTISVVAPTGASITQTLTVQAPVLSTLSLSSTSATPQSLSDNTSVTGTVSLTGNAPASGVVVSLSSNNAAVATLPASVTVQAGQNSAAFPVTIIPVPANVPVILTAQKGVSRTQTLTVKTPLVSAFSFNPTNVTGTFQAGEVSSTASFTLDGVAPSAGLTMARSSDSNFIRLDSPTLNLPAGSRDGSFPVRATPAVTQNVATVSVTLSGTTRSATLTVKPPIPAQLTLIPASIIGGVPSSISTATLQLTGPVAAGSLAVPLSSSSSVVHIRSSNDATPITQVNISAMQSSAQFRLSADFVGTDTVVAITAGQGSASATAQLDVRNQVVNVSSLVFSAPTVVGGGFNFTGTVTLAEPSVGSAVNLVSNNPVARFVVNPGPPEQLSTSRQLPIPQGQTTVGFPIRPSPVANDTSVTITANPGNISQTFTLLAPSVTSLSVSPPSIKGGVTGSGLVQLNGPAPSNGFQIQLTSSSPSATVPPVVSVIANQNFGSFAVTTSPVTVSTPVTITATAPANNSQRTFNLTINP